MSQTDNFLRAKEAAQYLGISRFSFWRWVLLGLIPKGTRLSNCCTILPRAALLDFVEKQGDANAR